MATIQPPATTPAAPSLNELRATGRNLALAFFWAAAMFVILALWLGRKHANLPGFVLVLVWLVAVACLGLAVWQALTACKKTAAVSDAPLLVRQRGLLAKVLLGGGLVCILWGLYFAIQYGLGGMGESLGLIIVGFTAAISGRVLLAKPRGADAPPALLDFLRSNSQVLSNILLALSGALTVLAAYFIFFKENGADFWPETLACVLLALLFTAASIWLKGTAATEHTLGAFRILVLVVGGAAGLILFLAVCLRALLWRDVVLFGGLRGWLGEDGWKVWLVAYVGLAALALMFGSLLLARADVRSNPVLRRTLYGYNLVLNGLLLFVVLAILNIVVYALLPYQFDWTKSRGLHALNTRSKAVLASLKNETTIYVVMTQNRKAHLDLFNLLDNAQVESTKIKLKPVDPNFENNDYKVLMDRFPAIFKSVDIDRRGPRARRGLLVVYGSLPADLKDKLPPHVFIAEEAIYSRGDNPHNPSLTFKGEVELMKELNNFVQERKRKVYVMQGNKELNLNEKGLIPRQSPAADLANLGAGLLSDKLTRDRFELMGLSFAEEPPGDKNASILYVPLDENKKKDVPKDAEAVLILGPSEPYSREALDALDRYLDRGGKMIAALDVVAERGYGALKQSGVEDLLKKRGVLVGSEFLMAARFEDDWLAVAPEVPENSRNDLAQKMAAGGLFFRTVRPIRPDPTAARYAVDVLLQVEPRSRVWLEAAPAILADPLRHVITLDKAKELRKRFSKEPIPVAVAVSEGGKPQLVVFGDAEFVSNRGLRHSEQFVDLDHYGWLAGAMEYLSDRPTFIGPTPKESTMFSLGKGLTYPGVKTIPGLIMVFFIVGLGVGLWIVRRR